MDYKLARELEAAGFPQAGKGTWIGPLDKLTWRSGDQVYVPTLEELVKACVALTDDHDFHLEAYAGDWQASVCKAKDTGEWHDWHRGASMHEAVARLWLALHTPAKPTA